jgi:hypothetical protein
MDPKSVAFCANPAARAVKKVIHNLRKLTRIVFIVTKGGGVHQYYNKLEPYHCNPSQTGIMF